MNLSDIQAKEVISVLDGRKLGKIVDANVNINEGKVIYFVCEQRKFFKRFFSSSSETKFTFDHIEKIGEDVILIKL